MNARPTQWHHGSGPGDKDPARGTWYAEVGGAKVAWAWVSPNSEVGDPGRYTGFIYGELAQTTTLREFKDAVEIVRAAIIDAVRGLR